MNKKLVLGFIALVVASGSFYFAHRAMTYVSTNDAMIEAKTTMLSFQVPGVIQSVNVGENEVVTQNQVLATIDPTDYQNALDRAHAEFAALAAQQNTAKINYQRNEALFKENAVSAERRDFQTGDYNALTAKLKVAESAIRQAQENLDHTKIVAPADGKVAKKSFELGMTVTPGQPIIGLVMGHDRWVVANFKETELKDIRPGKKAIIKVDAYPGKTFSGEVESISPSTGASFSLLPPDNAVGNFTKVVQRVPVKIKLLHLSAEDIGILQTGLSVSVSVKR